MTDPTSTPPDPVPASGQPLSAVERRLVDRVRVARLVSFGVLADE